MITQGLEAEIAHERPSRRRNGGIDWLAIESDYRAGVLSLRALAEKHGCAHSTIANYAGRQGWSREQPRRCAA